MCDCRFDFSNPLRTTAPNSQIRPLGLVWEFLFLLGWRDLKPKRVFALIILIRKNGDFTFSTTTHKNNNPQTLLVFGGYSSSGFIIMISRFFLLAYAMVLAVPPLLPSHTAIM